MTKNLDSILKIGLNRVKTLSVTAGASCTPHLKAVFLVELAELGYKVDNHELINDSILENHALIISTLKEMKGGHVDYVPLFTGFPNKVPNKEEFLTKRIFGYLGNVFGLFSENDPGVKLHEIHPGVTLAIPEWLFDLTEFGADPIFGRQTRELFEQGLASQKSRKGDDHTEFIHLTVTEDITEVVKGWLANTLYAKSSIKESLKDDINTLIGFYGLDFVDASKVVFKEIKSYVMKNLWINEKFDALKRYIGTPTDILRLFAALTDSDISLAENIKFPKLKRKERRFILSQIEKCSGIAENLNVYKGLWVELGRYLHPGEYKDAFPKTYSAFDTLRNSKVSTYGGQIEGAIKSGDAVLVTTFLKKRPGIFARRLHEVLVAFDNDVKIIDAFAEVANEVELKNLLVLERYFKTINDSDFRTVINKRGKVIVFDNTKKSALSKDALAKLDEVLKGAITAKIAEKPIEFEEGAKVWVDPELVNYTVPLSLRKQSNGLLNISRGTRVKFDNTKVLRLFCYWKESSRRTDYDTSLIEFDGNMNYKGHVSYTNLSSDGIIHSGDCTSAPYGAAEFIDINMKSLKKGIRYLGIQIYIYSGERFFQAAESMAGWMIRDRVNNDRSSFDIKTVANKIDVRGKGSYAIPIIVDVVNSEIVFVDLYMDGPQSLNRVEGAVNDVSTVAREIVKMVDTKPNMYDLVIRHIEASNAELVENKEDATVTYGINECTHSVDRVDEILAEML
jgi:stress response protein SCP2